MRANYQDDLFGRLEAILASHERAEFYVTFESLCALRRDVRDGFGPGAFPEQRLLIFQLDCLLEEMGYLSLRHLAKGRVRRERHRLPAVPRYHPGKCPQSHF